MIRIQPVHAMHAFTKSKLTVQLAVFLSKPA